VRALGLVLVAGAVAWRSPWPLAGAVALVVAWTTGPPVVAFARRHRGRGPDKGNRTGGVDPSWLPPFTDADATLPARAEVRPPAMAYRVTFTSKAQHVETRRYPDGRTLTVDTRTGSAVGETSAHV
jgi:hypothetical protein